MAIGALDAASAYGRALKTTAPSFGTADDASSPVAGNGSSFGSVSYTHLTLPTIYSV